MKPETLGYAAVVIVLALFVWVAGVDELRQRRGKRRLLDRYQTRAFRSSMSELYADQWVQRPYGSFRPEDVQA